MASPKDFESDYENQWCPGCGNFGILAAMKDAFVQLGLAPHQLLLVSGIGQAAKTPHFLKCNLFHSLHGRALPLATGAKTANHEMTVVVNTGDGDCYGEGGNHFIHAIRRNVDLTVLAHNNKVYGLTKGQPSPTSDRGMQTKIQPRGVFQDPFNPIAVALALGAGFVARAFAGDTEQLSRIIQAAVKFRGFSLVDILQPCVSFNTVNTHGWYKKRVYDLQAEGHVPDDYAGAMTKAQEWGDRIPTGIFYQQEKPVFTDAFPALQEGPLLDRAYDPQRLRALLIER